MMRASIILAAAVLACAWQQPADTRAQVRALVDAGRLDEAERMARGGGASLQASLGDVLVMRGRLAQADSVLRAASEICRARFEKTFLQTMASWLVDADKRLSSMP